MELGLPLILSEEIWTPVSKARIRWAGVRNHAWIGNVSESALRPLSGRSRTRRFRYGARAWRCRYPPEALLPLLRQTQRQRQLPDADLPALF